MRFHTCSTSENGRIIIKKVEWLIEHQIFIHSRRVKTTLEKPCAVVACRDGRFWSDIIDFHGRRQHCRPFIQPHPIFGGVHALAENSPVSEMPGADTVYLNAIRMGWEWQNKPIVHAKSHAACPTLEKTGIDPMSAYSFDLYAAGIARIQTYVPCDFVLPLFDVWVPNTSSAINRTWPFEIENWKSLRSRFIADFEEIAR